MDQTRFDGLTRMMATGSTRRQVCHGLTGGTVAVLLSHFGIEEAAAGCVKPGQQGCDGPRHRQCCDGATCKGGTNTKQGRCVCKGRLKQCGSTCVNAKTDENNCGSCKKKCAAGHACKRGKCTSKLGCRVGENFCNRPNGPNCPHTTNTACFCITDVEGTPRCSNISTSICQSCVTNADCGAGRACLDGSGINCQCPGNGNVCSASTCDDSS